MQSNATTVEEDRQVRLKALLEKEKAELEENFKKELAEKADELKRLYTRLEALKKKVRLLRYSSIRILKHISYMLHRKQSKRRPLRSSVKNAPSMKPKSSLLSW